MRWIRMRALRSAVTPAGPFPPFRHFNKNLLVCLSQRVDVYATMCPLCDGH